MLKVMLDTNVLIKFAFVLDKLYRDIHLPKNLEKYKFILEKFERAKFLNVMSIWNEFELRDKLMNLKLAEVFFMSGFSVDEFRDAKNEGINLSKDNIGGVNDMVYDIWKSCERSTKDMNMEKLSKLNKKDYSMMDLILIHQAELNQCDYFVTNDAKLYLSEELKKEFKVKICAVNEFKSKL